MILWFRRFLMQLRYPWLCRKCGGSRIAMEWGKWRCIYCTRVIQSPRAHFKPPIGFNSPADALRFELFPWR